MQGNNSEKMILEESLSKPQITSFENDELKNNINQINSEEEKFLKIQSILSINQNQKNYEPEPGLFKDIDDKSEKDFPKEHENQNTDLNLLSESDINKTVIIDESYPFVPKLHVISRYQKYSNKYFHYERFKDKPLSQSLGLSGCQITGLPGKLRGSCRRCRPRGIRRSSAGRRSSGYPGYLRRTQRRTQRDRS